MMFFSEWISFQSQKPSTAHIMSLKLILPVNIMPPDHGESRLPASAQYYVHRCIVFQLSYFDYSTTFLEIMRLREFVERGARHFSGDMFIYYAKSRANPVIEVSSI